MGVGALLPVSSGGGGKPSKKAFVTKEPSRSQSVSPGVKHHQQPLKGGQRKTSVNDKPLPAPTLDFNEFDKSLLKMLQEHNVPPQYSTMNPAIAHDSKYYSPPSKLPPPQHQQQQQQHQQHQQHPVHHINAPPTPPMMLSTPLPPPQSPAPPMLRGLQGGAHVGQSTKKHNLNTSWF